MKAVGYIPFVPTVTSTEAGWLSDVLGCEVPVLAESSTLNLTDLNQLPPVGYLHEQLIPFLDLPWIVAEGIGGLLWACLLRSRGYKGGFVVLPYLNPRSWFDIACIQTYLHFADPRDRVFIGSLPSAKIFRALGVKVNVHEPFGINCDIFRPSPGNTPGNSSQISDVFEIPRGPMLLFAGRVQPDKNILQLLSVALKARLLFPDLVVVIAAHVVDEAYIKNVRHLLDPERGIHFVLHPSTKQLAALYRAASVFITASTSHFETFGRAPAEALACGTPAVAPNYDGFAEVLDQPGGTLVDVEFVDGEPQANEAQLLRAVYEVLSSLNAHHESDEIAAIAQKRFCRNHTINVLEFLGNAKAAPPNVNAVVQCTNIKVPPQWQSAKEEIDHNTSDEALANLWSQRSLRKLSRLDEEFRKSVRVALANPSLSNRLQDRRVKLCH